MFGTLRQLRAWMVEKALGGVSTTWSRWAAEDRRFSPELERALAEGIAARMREGVGRAGAGCVRRKHGS